jgi:hypothetical protein
MKTKIILAAMFTSLIFSSVYAAPVAELLQQYQAQSARPFDAQAGKTLWTRSFGVSSEGKERRCATCHTEDLRQAGKHIKTGKLIEPLAPSVNTKRLTDSAEIEKWFKRNCEWTLGRECSAQEKGDFLSYIRMQ